MAAALGAALGTLAVAAHAEDMAACQDSYVAGQRHYKLEHDFLGAREQLLLCAKTCPDELRASCGQWLTEIGRELPSIVVKAKDGGGHDVLDAVIEVDGKAASGALDGTPIDLNPGEHTIRVLRPRRPAAQETVVLHPGERLRVVEVWTEPREAISVPMHRPIPLGAFILAGVSAASLASFGVFAAWTTWGVRPHQRVHPELPAFRSRCIVHDQDGDCRRVARCRRRQPDRRQRRVLRPSDRSPGHAQDGARRTLGDDPRGRPRMECGVLG